MGCTGSNPGNNVVDRGPPPMVDVVVVEPALSTAELGGHPSTTNATKRPSDTTGITPPTKPTVKPWDENKVEKLCFGAGCYWGTEKYFRHDFAKSHSHLGMIKNGHVGFMGPIYASENPSYREVCSGETGHVEVYDLEYVGGAEYCEALIKFFFQFHDPTTLNRQGNDQGTQYASVIYCYTDEQLEIAYKVKDELQALIDEGKVVCFKSKVVTTDIRKSTKFYPAHEEHQDYLMKNPNGYCNHRLRLKGWPASSQ